jgi:translocation and assembly module TamA
VHSKSGATPSLGHIFVHGRITRRLLATTVIGIGAVTDPLSGPALAADPEPYHVTVKPTGQADVDAAIQASSMLVSLAKTKAIGPFALAGRIRGDYDRVSQAMQSYGYYDGTVTISVGTRGGPQRTLAGNDPELPNWLSGLPAKSSAEITISASRGPLFHIGHITLQAPAPAADTEEADDTAPKPKDAKPGHTARASAAPPVAVQTEPVTLSSTENRAFGLSSGQPANAADVLAAQGHLLTVLQEEGHAQASVATPRAYLKPQTHTLDLVFDVHMGPIVDIGPITFDGLKHVNPAFLRRRLTIHTGELYQPSAIEAARQDLAAIGVFGSVGARDNPPLVPDVSGGTPGVSQAMPVAFDFQEAKRHTVSAEVGYSTDLGGRAGVTWTHHNLFGNAEQLRLTALVTGVGGTAQQGLGYDVYADLMKPDWLRRDQNLSIRLEGIRQLLYSYRQTALLARAGVIRKLTRHWSISGSLSAEQEQIQQFNETYNYLIASVPLGATYDSTDLANPIEPATHGIRLSLNATPSESLEHREAFFVLLNAIGSTYFDLHRLGLTRPGRTVIAVRGIVGSVQGASTYQIPPDQRLYAGGPATVRGFRYQGVGPQFGNTKYAIGGTSLDAGSVEFRQRIGKSFGAAAFADAGQVGSGSSPFEGTLRVGVGGGVRYYTPIGPIRVDIAVPMNRPARGDKWELYIGLGENF